jgi:hypothetical protein
MLPFIGPEMAAALFGHNRNDSTKGSEEPRQDRRIAALRRSGTVNTAGHERRFRYRPRRLIRITTLIIDFYLWLDIRM